MKYRSATETDIELIIKQRVLFFESGNDLSDAKKVLEDNCRNFFTHALKENRCDVILVEDNDKCIGIGIVFYYDSIPSLHNIRGKNAYATNIYVDENYRKKGIGGNILQKIISKAKEREYPVLMLNASEEGEPLYKKAGFVTIEHGMILYLQN